MQYSRDWGNTLIGSKVIGGLMDAQRVNLSNTETNLSLFFSWLSRAAYSFTFISAPLEHFHAWNDKLIASRSLFLLEERIGNSVDPEREAQAMAVQYIPENGNGSRVSFIYAFPLPPFLLLHKNNLSALPAVPLWLRLRSPRENCAFLNVLYFHNQQTVLTIDHRSRIPMQYQ